MHTCQSTRTHTCNAFGAQVRAGRLHVIPTSHGARGHPVGFAARCGDALSALQGPSGAASIVQAFGATELAVQDEGILVDVDTLQALRRAEAIVRARGG